AWVFPANINQQPSFNRGVYDARLARQRPRASLPNILADSMQTHFNEPNPTQLAGHPIHLFTPRNRLSVPRLLLAGDSAGVDPLFGEGISPALAYGKIAAVTLMRAFQTGDFSFREYRRRVFVSKLGWYLTLRWTIAWTCYHLSGKRRFMHTLWTFGGLLARVWPEPETLHSSKFHE
ncbi:MAG: NAD(P)/FAD-dependent oxidoreductase, partial [Anaerolineales bacterium]